MELEEFIKNEIVNLKLSLDENDEYLHLFNLANDKQKEEIEKIFIDIKKKVDKLYYIQSSLWSV